MIFCKQCGAQLHRGQRLFCSRTCYHAWEKMGANACRVGRLGYVKGQHSHTHKTTPEMQCCEVKERDTVYFNDYISPNTRKGLEELLVELKDFRKTLKKEIII